jgi:hypothetical protein
MGLTIPDENSQEVILAVREAQNLARKIKEAHGDLQPAYEALDMAIPQFEKAYPLESLFQYDSEIGLGFALQNNKTGKNFWKVYGKIAREKLCDKKEEFNNQVKKSTEGITTLLVIYIMDKLSVPIEAIVLVAPIIAILVTSGIDAICSCTE